jgi:hypothetical protein
LLHDLLLWLPKPPQPSYLLPPFSHLQHFLIGKYLLSNQLISHRQRLHWLLEVCLHQSLPIVSTVHTMAAVRQLHSQQLVKSTSTGIPYVLLWDISRSGLALNTMNFQSTCTRQVSVRVPTQPATSPIQTLRPPVSLSSHPYLLRHAVLQVAIPEQCDN